MNVNTLNMLGIQMVDLCPIIKLWSGNRIEKSLFLV